MGELSKERGRTEPVVAKLLDELRTETGGTHVLLVVAGAVDEVDSAAATIVDIPADDLSPNERHSTTGGTSARHGERVGIDPTLLRARHVHDAHEALALVTAELVHVVLAVEPGEMQMLSLYAREFARPDFVVVG